MSANVINISSYRKRKSKDRVFEALEQFHQEVLLPLQHEKAPLNPEEYEEFIVQLLGDHLVGLLESVQDMRILDERYRHFDGRLRRCLQTKLKSLAIFENAKRF
jgi:hypothetical protein